MRIYIPKIFPVNLLYKDNINKSMVMISSIVASKYLYDKISISKLIKKLV